jgi:hypothetical protein
VPTVKKRTAGNEHDPDLSAESVQIITVIDTATINQIKKVLLDEPDVVLGSILSIYKWSWKDEFMEALSIKRRKKIERLIRVKETHPFNTIVAESILAIVLDKLRGKYKVDTKSINRGIMSLYFGG